MSDCSSRDRPAKWHLAAHCADDAKYRPFAVTRVADWRTLFYTMCGALVLYLVRSGFRIAEYQGGFDSVSIVSLLSPNDIG